MKYDGFQRIVRLFEVRLPGSTRYAASALWAAPSLHCADNRGALNHAAHLPTPTAGLISGVGPPGTYMTIFTESSCELMETKRTRSSGYSQRENLGTASLLCLVLLLLQTADCPHHCNKLVISSSNQWSVMSCSTHGLPVSFFLCEQTTTKLLFLQCYVRSSTVDWEIPQLCLCRVFIVLFNILSDCCLTWLQWIILQRILWQPICWTNSQIRKTDFKCSKHLKFFIITSDKRLCFHPCPLVAWLLGLSAGLLKCY